MMCAVMLHAYAAGCSAECSVVTCVLRQPTLEDQDTFWGVPVL